jgi:DeoR family fructose operon transcriptional repressor
MVDEQMEKKLTPVKRRKLILGFLDEERNTTVSYLSSELCVPEATIRRDLMNLEQRNLVIRTHGGAVLKKQATPWKATNLQVRYNDNREEKKRIARHVASIIQDNEILMIDGGSTNLYVAEQLVKKENLVIITNNSNIGEIFVSSKETRVYLTGGELIRGPNTLVGSIAEGSIKQFRADRAIIGLNGIVPEEGFFAALPQEAIIKKLMLKYSRELILVADSSKMDVRSFFLVDDLSKAIRIVTGKEIEQGVLDRLRAQNLRVDLV